MYIASAEVWVNFFKLSSKSQTHYVRDKHRFATLEKEKEIEKKNVQIYIKFYLWCGYCFLVLP